MRRGDQLLGQLLVGLGVCALVGCQTPETRTTGTEPSPGVEEEPPSATTAEDLPPLDETVPLSEVIHRALELLDEAPPYDRICVDLTAWPRMQRMTRELPGSDLPEDPSWAVLVGRLEYLGCGFGEAPIAGSSITVPAVEVVLREPSDDRLPDLRPAQTAAGRDVALARADWNGWRQYVEDAWIARYHEPGAEVIVVSPGELSGETEILSSLDAAITDLTWMGSLSSPTAPSDEPGS